MKPTIYFSDINNDNFTEKAIQVFRYQAQNNPVYKEFINRIHCDIFKVETLEKIPFLPISFFKSHQIITENQKIVKIFLSSGTTGTSRSKHFISDLNLYKRSFQKSFNLFFGSIEEYTVLALLPSYIERKDSSLVYMVAELIKKSKKNESGFYLNNYKELSQKLLNLDKKGEKVLLLGVSYALLDLIAYEKFKLRNTIVMETGGMKGRRKEMIKKELHEILKKGFGVPEVFSEYGMTELLSQAYSSGSALFHTPPWMKVLIREVEDPLTIQPIGKSGGINIIDLANINSCSFIATQDLGKIYANGSFEIIGRFDYSDIRGCNLMLS